VQAAGEEAEVQAPVTAIGEGAVRAMQTMPVVR
jgi:hypothetical protein